MKYGLVLAALFVCCTVAAPRARRGRQIQNAQTQQQVPVAPLSDPQEGGLAALVWNAASTFERGAHARAQHVWTIRFCSEIDQNDVADSQVANVLLQLQNGAIQFGMLDRPLNRFYSVAFSTHSCEYRIIFTINHSTRTMVIHAIGPRETIYPRNPSSFITRHTGQQPTSCRIVN